MAECDEIMPSNSEGCSTADVNNIVQAIQPGVACDVCHQTFKNQRGMMSHRSRHAR